MTIPFGRRRLVVSLSLTPSHSLTWDEVTPAGGTDADLARLNRHRAPDIETTRWQTLYGWASRS